MLWQGWRWGIKNKVIQRDGWGYHIHFHLIQYLEYSGKGSNSKMSVICIVLVKTVQHWAQQDCHETNYTSKLHLLDPLSFASYFNFFVDENFDLSPKNLETNPNVSPDIHLRRQREMVEKWTPAKIFCRVKNHEQRIVAMFCWLGEKFPPQSWTWRIFRNIFRSRLSLFSLRSWGRILLHCCHGSYFSWWLALCHTRPAFMTTCRIVAFTASPLKRFTAAKTLLCDSAEFASAHFFKSGWRTIKWYAE